MEKVTRKSPQGVLAQKMFDAWLEGYGSDHGKFPKYIADRPSIWWIMACVAYEKIGDWKEQASLYQDLWDDAETELAELKRALRTLGGI